ncbi:hypothetical protein BO70DRAFT_13024 [Aspergillus heteromorphus CBS 117.55]|uniref:Uncharacterized protein n=1 Tax=Aspergillus heteromorphus CBS 117.55 TaxID=1448321 RepID=A0A317X6K8_9EURO|nr:uncharacterized protein BO70DRAFT_13024 [Aspergillus heteromorphus CBS 117.55]PWY92518.1 hypothetical protein BO70DRAFT_13024 [Aspergillus heteromorphus CBS 117.55]
MDPVNRLYHHPDSKRSGFRAGLGSLHSQELQINTSSAFRPTGKLGIFSLQVHLSFRDFSDMDRGSNGPLLLRLCMSTYLSTYLHRATKAGLLGVGSAQGPGCARVNWTILKVCRLVLFPIPESDTHSAESIILDTIDEARKATYVSATTPKS